MDDLAALRLSRLRLSGEVAGRMCGCVTVATGWTNCCPFAPFGFTFNRKRTKYRKTGRNPFAGCLGGCLGETLGGDFGSLLHTAAGCLLLKRPFVLPLMC